MDCRAHEFLYYVAHCCLKRIREELGYIMCKFEVMELVAPPQRTSFYKNKCNLTIQNKIRSYLKSQVRNPEKNENNPKSLIQNFKNFRFSNENLHF